MSDFTYTAEMSDTITEAMEQALKEWDEGVVWVDTTRRFADGSEKNVRYAPSEFAYKFGDRVAARLGGRTYE